MNRNLLTAGILFLASFIYAQTPRLSLFEEFTGETCPPCAATNPGLNNILLSATNATKIVAIKWQVPIPSAPTAAWSLYQTDKPDIDWRYRTGAGNYNYVPNVTYAPFGKIDGQSLAAYGSTGSNVDHPANVTNNMIALAQSYTSAFSVSMTRAWNPTGGPNAAVNLTVNIQATAPYSATSNSLVFRTVLVERVINFSVQPGTNGEKDFYDAARGVFPTTAGIPLAQTWTVGQTQTFTMTCALPSYIIKKSEVAFVGFIQNDVTQKVEQSVRADKQPVPYDANAISAYANPVCSGTFAPLVTVKNDGASAITNMTITPYVDGVVGNTTSWSGNLASGATVNITLNSINSPSTNGAHTFSYNISALNGADLNLSNNTNKVSYFVANSFPSTPIVEGFSATTFPYAGWAIVNSNASPAWTYYNGTGAYNFTPYGCIYYNFFTNTTVGDKDEMFVPSVDLTGTGNPIMTFDYAYQQRLTSSNDGLDIYASKDCGATWTNIYSNSGFAMATNPNANPNTFVPADVDWQNVTVNFPTGFNVSGVIVKFVTTNDHGNNLFLDNINLSATGPNAISKYPSNLTKVSVYPNPTNGVANLQISSTKNVNAKVTVMNIAGQIVLEKQISLVAGLNNSTFDLTSLSSGMYSVIVDTENSRTISKVSVNK